MQKYFLIGTPISHSLSPLMMNLSFRENGIDAEYNLLETGLEGLEAHIKMLRDTGASGWNVTMPCKSAMCTLCDTLSPAAAVCGAVNTVKNDGGKLYGHTTDGAGLISALGNRGISLKGKRAVLFGSGGAAGIIMVQSALEGAEEIFVYCNRPASRVRTEALAEKLRQHSPCTITVRSYTDTDVMQRDLEKSAVLINASNIGMEGGPDPSGCLLPDSVRLPSGLFVYDIIYHPAETPLIRRAQAAGNPCESGLSMLIGQGAESFRIWTGQQMPVREVTDALRRALR